MTGSEVAYEGSVDVTDQQLGLLTVPEVAKLLRRGPRSTWQLVWDGEIASLKVGHGRRVTRRAVADYQAREEKAEIDRRAPAGTSGSAA